MSIKYKNPITNEEVTIQVTMSAPYAVLTSAIVQAIEVNGSEEEFARSIVSAVNDEMKNLKFFEVAVAENPLAEICNRHTYGKYTITMDGGIPCIGTVPVVMADKVTPNYVEYKDVKRAISAYNRSIGEDMTRKKLSLAVDFGTKDMDFFRAVGAYVAKTAPEYKYKEWADMGGDYALLADVANMDKAFNPSNKVREDIVNACYAIINKRTGLDVSGVGVVFMNLKKDYEKRNAKTATDSEKGGEKSFVNFLMIEYINSKFKIEDNINSRLEKKKKTAKK